MFIFFAFCIGTLLIYFFGLKREWHELRKQRGFVTANNSTVPRMREKNLLGQNIFLGPCFRLLFFSLIISIFICLFYIFTVPNLEFDSAKDMIGGLFLFVSLWAIFLDVSISKEAVITKQHSKVFGHLYAFIAWIKGIILNHIISLEKKILYDTVRRYINRWYIAWMEEKDIKLGILILRLDENYLDKLVSSEEIMGLKREIVLLFGNKGFTLVDLLCRFFTVEIERNGIVFEDILRFLYTVEITCMNQDKSDLQMKLQKCVEKAQEYTKLPESSTISVDSLDSVYALKKMITSAAVAE